MKQQTASLPGETAGHTGQSAKNQPIVEGKQKSYYATEQPGFIIQRFTTNGADESKKRPRRATPAALKNSISSYLFEYLDGYHIPTHYIRKMSDTDSLVRKLEMIPLLIKVYNYAIGPLARRFGRKDGTPLDFPVIEHYYRTGAQGLSWTNEYHLYAFGIMTPDEFKQINRLSTKINAVLRSLCDRRKLTLVDIQLEYGRYNGQIYLGDELSPAACHFWDAAAEGRTQRDRFAPDSENAEESYAELLERLSMRA